MYLILLSLIGLLFASSTAIEKPQYDLGQVEALFEEFISSFNKTYSDLEEKVRRLEIFTDNLKMITYLNLVSEAAHGVNQFTDLTNEEFVSKYTGFVPRPDDMLQSACQVITDSDINTNEAPASLDYRSRAVTEVKDQNPCNSCWAFSTIGSIEGAFALKHGTKVRFSEQQLMDCLRCSKHCAVGGSMVDAISELIQTPGVEYESDYKYVGRDLECQFNQVKAQVRITGCRNYQLRDENKLKEALYQHGPISIGINGNTLNTYHGGIYDVWRCPPRPLNHAVLLVGYGTEGGKDYWLIKNSYGHLFGERGYLRISRGSNTCGLMNNDAMSAIVA